MRTLTFAEILSQLEELVNTRYPNSRFLQNPDNRISCANFALKNIENNGFHIFKIWVKNGEIISYLDYIHLKDLKSRFNLDIKLRELLHPGFSLTLPDGSHLVSLMTSQNHTLFTGLGMLPNILLHNNMFLGANPIIMVDAFTYGFQFEVINNPARLPLNIRHRHLDEIIVDSWNAFSFSFQQSLQMGNIIRLNGASGLYSNTGISEVAHNHFNAYDANFNQNRSYLQRVFHPSSHLL